MERPSTKVIFQLALPAIMLLSMLVIYFPLPTWLMDLMLAANLGLAVVLLLATVFVKTPLELKVFPALLLISTLLRLSLNVATTRLILSQGASAGEAAAGQMINGFAQFVAADSIIVGAIIFLILFVVQFLVITKGATRIGEVAARFALDSMPGRQMAIDADLNSGAITFEEAQRRRRELVQYADFQGSMDGASKYVRGDAIAGVVITGINIVGGIAQGLIGGMSLSQASEVFTRLTIGDGLVSQLPALLISVAAGLLITRGTDESDLPKDSISQLLSSPWAMWSAAAFLFILPMANLPAIPLWTMGGFLVVIGSTVSRSEQQQKVAQSREAKPVAKEPKIERFLETDQIELQLGVQLLSLCGPQPGHNLVGEISKLRGEIAGELGIVLPKVRIRDNLQMPGDFFRVLLDGNVVMEGKVEKEQQLYIYTRDTFPVGEKRANFDWAPYAVWGIKDPESLPPGTQVLNPTAVLVQTMRWLVGEHADQLLTRDATNELIEETKKTFPRLVADTVPEIISIGQLQKTFRQLLREGIALRPMHLILECLHETKGHAGDQRAQVREIRESLQRHTAQRLLGPDGRITCFGIADDLTDSLEGSLVERDGGLAMPPKFNSSIQRNLRMAVQSGAHHLMSFGHRPILLVSSTIAEVVKKTVAEIHPRVVVLSEEEVPSPALLNMIAEITPGDLPKGKGSQTAA
jgi:flagellar biosynthesis protein FlhA